MRYRNPGSRVEDLGEAAVQELTRELETTFDDDAGAAIIGLKRKIDAAQAELLVRVADFEQRDIARIEHGVTTAGWLRRFCRMTASQASSVVKTARALASMSAVRERAAIGDITIEGVRMLAFAMDRHPDAFTVHEDVFADIATYLEPRDLKRAINHWEQQVDHDSAVQDTTRRRNRRSVYFSQTLDGMWDLLGTLDPESGHTIDTALRSISDPALIDTTDDRTMPQCRSDALTELCRFWLDHNTTARTAGGERPHITVTVDYHSLIYGVDADGLLPEFDGTPVDAEAMRRLACDAGVVRILLDSESQPLDVGRRVRTVTPAIRRALELRDGGCTWGGCRARAAWCDAHHIVHWADGGETTLENLRLLCRRHHVLIHQGKAPPRDPSEPGHDPRCWEGTTPVASTTGHIDDVGEP